MALNDMRTLLDLVRYGDEVLLNIAEEFDRRNEPKREKIHLKPFWRDRTEDYTGLSVDSITVKRNLGTCTGKHETKVIVNSNKYVALCERPDFEYPCISCRYYDKEECVADQFYRATH